MSPESFLTNFRGFAFKLVRHLFCNAFDVQKAKYAFIQYKQTNGTILAFHFLLKIYSLSFSDFQRFTNAVAFASDSSLSPPKCLAFLLSRVARLKVEVVKGARWKRGRYVDI